MLSDSFKRSKLLNAIQIAFVTKLKQKIMYKIDQKKSKSKMLKFEREMQ